ncbi:putative importin, protein [Suhomyces tanzawaensis NRRL Y-17324]|uniref:Putative importin, protein n=1 Tax=Suhomyces tanzawaensis NRRL Y-17324 TaxID=984487 RepID=A0A1E4SF19_9ASCO|nr:putative importin, protein [Suhomyces tanzawaensis NRRL Y-17324]ODV78066.1 putative importin, protein [Suhomyces tanzawaensis NRRL Y-17324]
MSFTADPAALEQLKQIFSSTLSSNNQERKSANEALSQAKTQPEFENYLFHLLVLDNSAKSEVRAGSGINLKNSILKSAHAKGNAPNANRQYLLDNILKGLLVQDNLVRNITGNVVTSLFSIYGIEYWPNVLPQLIELANHEAGPYDSQEAAMNTLGKICEDSSMVICSEYKGESPLNFMLSNLLKLMVHPHSGIIRALSIHCVNQFIPLNPQEFSNYQNQFLQNLFELSKDSSTKVKKNICSSFSMILETSPNTLLPHLDGVVNYCLHLMQDNDEEVALEACEFLLSLSSISEDEVNKQIFIPKLKLILPILLGTMVYSEEEVFLMELESSKDITSVQDKEEDIKPKNVKVKEHSAKSNYRKEDDDSDDDSDEDSDSDSDSLVDQWSLRKCSAATLDILSLNLPGEVLEISLPILQERILSTDWKVREASILAFGAISKSCIELSDDKLPTLVTYLIERLKDPQPRLRQITCWTISRFASWIITQSPQLVDLTIQSILASSLDQQKIVQQSACSSLTYLIEEAYSESLLPYLDQLLHHFTRCFQIYQKKNLAILYDCIQTFVEKLGYENLSKSENIKELIPPLLSKWEELDDNDNALWSLLECIASIASTLGELFAPYAVPIYQRAVKILTNCIELDQQAQTDPLIETPEKDFIVTSLDLIDGLIQGFGFHSAELIDQRLMELLLICLEDHSNDVRQSAYALLGDLAISVCDVIVKPWLRSIVLSIGNEINNRNYESYPVVNNAIWSLGEMLMRLPPHEIKPYFENLVDLIIPVLISTDTQQTVLENCAICLGRMGISGDPELCGLLGQKLPGFILQWCSQMLYLIDNEEKETGFTGMLNIINTNPVNGFGGFDNSQGKKNLGIFFVCIGSYAQPSDELRGLFGQMLNSFKGLLGSEWEGVMAHVDHESRGVLASVYGVH